MEEKQQRLVRAQSRTRKRKLRLASLMGARGVPFESFDPEKGGSDGQGEVSGRDHVKSSPTFFGMSQQLAARNRPMTDPDAAAILQQQQSAIEEEAVFAENNDTANGKALKKSKKSNDNRVELIPLEEASGPNGDSVDAYKNFLRSVDSRSKRVRAQRNFETEPEDSEISKNKRLLQQRAQRRGDDLAKSRAQKIENLLGNDWALVRSLSLHSTSADGFKWVEMMHLPEVRHPDDKKVIECLEFFEHPSSTMSCAVLQKLAEGNFEPYDIHHSQFRCEGEGDVKMNAEKVLRRVGSSEQQKMGGASDFMISNVGKKPTKVAEVSSTTTGIRKGNVIDDTSSFIFNRRCEWGKAFRSLFTLFELGKCPHFYLLDRENDMTVLFLGASVLASNEDSPAIVLLSRSSPSFRGLLSRCNVAFRCPLDPSLEKEEEAAIDPELQDELKAYSRSATSSMALPNAVTAQLTRSSSYTGDEDHKTLLAIHGKQNVHALFNVLVNRVVKRSGMHEVPKLLSPTRFYDATCRSSTISGPKIVKSPNGTEREVVGVSGFTPTHARKQLIAEIEKIEKPAKVDVKIQADPNTRFFNEALFKIAQTNQLL